MINVQLESKQRELFGVLCLHHFYTDKVTRDLEFEPTLETAATLKNYALVMKPMAFGFLVLYNPETSSEKLRTMPKGMRLSFLIRNKNRQFMNFTQVPFWPEGMVFHYSNANPQRETIPFEPPREIYYYFKNIGLGEESKKVLHLPQHPLIGLRPRKFNAVPAGGREEGVSYDKVKIFDEKGQERDPNGVFYLKRFRDTNREFFKRHVDHEMMKMKQSGMDPSEIQRRIGEVADRLEKELSTTKYTNFVIDLKHVPSGRYTIDWDGVREDVYTTDDSDSRPFGAIDIFLDGAEDALLNRSATSDAELVRPQMFVIKYEARTTYWRYFFVNYENSIVSPVSIRDENEVLSFSQPTPGIMEQMGTPAVIAESLQPIALREHPEQVLFLERANGKRSMKELRLPTPAPDLVKPVRKDGKELKLYSDVYVYL